MRHGIETGKSHEQRTRSGFYEKYMQGEGLDIGPNRDPVLPTAIGVDKNYPDYDGVTLPFPSKSKDYVYTSHCLEHIPSSQVTGILREWFRVLKVNGYLVITVPHQFLYEKRQSLPSRYNPDHKRFYTPESLLDEIEVSLDVNTYRVRHLRDNDDGYDYSIPPERHSKGCYEIELVLQKITPPEWRLA